MWLLQNWWYQYRVEVLLQREVKLRGEILQRHMAVVLLLTQGDFNFVGLQVYYTNTLLVEQCTLALSYAYGLLVDTNSLFPWRRFDCYW
jgi:hypothetical protein